MYEQVQFPYGSPLKVKWDDFPHFTFPLHFHSEYEIVYIVKSYGKRYVGDSVESFGPDDLVLIGSQVPHYWKNDEVFHKNNPELKVNAIVVQFSEDFMSQALNKYPEFQRIKNLLNNASQGIRFMPPDNKKIKQQLIKLNQVSGINRLIVLLEILRDMSLSKKTKFLSQSYAINHIGNDSNDRLKKILNYLSRNYQQNITLTETAKLFGMNPSAFSRYFKNKTGQSLIEYLNNLRMNFACKLLQNEKMTITQICFECGFNNISNFNRMFKRRMSQTPKDYRNMHNK